MTEADIPDIDIRVHRDLAIDWYRNELNAKDLMLQLKAYNC